MGGGTDNTSLVYRLLDLRNQIWSSEECISQREILDLEWDGTCSNLPPSSRRQYGGLRGCTQKCGRWWVLLPVLQNPLPPSSIVMSWLSASHDCPASFKVNCGHVAKCLLMGCELLWCLSLLLWGLMFFSTFLFPSPWNLDCNCAGDDNALEMGKRQIRRNWVLEWSSWTGLPPQYCCVRKINFYIRVVPGTLGLFTRAA